MHVVISLNFMYVQVSKAAVVPLADAKVATCGSKAAACAQLLQLAGEAGSGFKATTGVVFPFGCMDLAIKARWLPYGMLQPLAMSAAMPALLHACSADSLAAPASAIGFLTSGKLPGACSPCSMRISSIC